MKIFNNYNISKLYQRSSLAIGNFDGSHRGHQKVFKYAKKFSKKNKAKFGIMTFSPLPIMFFNKKIKNYRLVSEKDKLKLLKKSGVDFVINLNFNKRFSKISAENFIKKIIYKKIYPKFIFVSGNFKFGNKRKGNVNTLRKFGTKYKYNLIKVKPCNYKAKIISSTRIRESLQAGKIQLANKLLSRTWFINGRVIRGKKLGRKLGYRTCNIRIKNYVLPKTGIYAVKLSLKDKKNMFKGVAYLGSRPTFKGKEIFLEIYIFNFNQNLYKKELSVYFIKFIRKDKKFKSSEELIEQMKKDEIAAKKYLKN